LLNAEDVTAFRTALVALLLFVRYEWKPSGNVVIFGAGKIVEWHLRLLLLLVPEKIESITLVNRSLSGLERLAGVISELRGRFEKVDFELVARDQEEEYEKILEEVVGESDAVFCCTPSTEPLFPHAYFGKERKRYISLIGSYKPNMQEVTKETLLAGDFLVVDSREACLSEAGELIMGGIKGKDVVELGDLIAERERFHIGEKGIVFKCVGMGIMDVAIGKELLNLARQKKLGIEVKNF
jgi:ornithine cyclodeaminase/alanine dehydrogenase-like protein (mu-crystallin family)